MERSIRMTADGSHIIAVPSLQATYHSIHGAIQESRHVYINAGLRYILNYSPLANVDTIRVFEMGFGTGLNAWLTLIEAAQRGGRNVYYKAVELFPLQPAEVAALNYDSLIDKAGCNDTFHALHNVVWDTDVGINRHFTLHKLNGSITNMQHTGQYHVIYYDAFAPDAQPELWTVSVFTALYHALSQAGVLVTYCCKGSVRHIMEQVGFITEKLPGPPGKREILRCIRL